MTITPKIQIEAVHTSADAWEITTGLITEVIEVLRVEEKERKLKNEGLHQNT